MKHYIIVKWKEEVTKEQKVEMIEPITKLFNQTLEIEGIKKVEVCPNVIDRSNRYDLMIEIEMEESSLVVYDNSNPHHIWKDTYSHLIEKKTIFDRG